PLTPFLRSNVARPPRHTLFPYTPLFRSQFLPHHLGTCPAQPEIEPLQRYCNMLQRDGESLVDGLRGQHDHPPLAICLSACPWPLDRKSTRLNSSHVKISYAVFCLKKKIC